MKLNTIKDILASTYKDLSKTDLDTFLNICEYRLLKKKEVLISSSEKSDHAFFILKGMMRGYFINKEGEEKSIFLRPEQTITGDPGNILKDESMKYTFESIFETHLLIFKYSAFEALAFEHQGLFKIYGLAFKENIRNLVLRIEGLINNTPEQRYNKLLATNPQFFQSALNKHVANYLGITPNSLSRMIKRRNER